MHTYTLQRSQDVPRPPAEVFRFFQEPRNLARITPPGLGFRILTPSPIVMRNGVELSYRIRVMGMPLRWKSRICGYEPPQRFVDEQILGPYALWRHTHTFEEIPGGTRVTDHVQYALPAGYAGRLIHQFLVRHQLRAIFDFREKTIARIFAGGNAETGSPSSTHGDQICLQDH
jgi:ligand-binding SRPBCC domain-containing protein